MTEPLAWLDDELARLDASHLRRLRLPHEGCQSASLLVAGQERLINFSSNDYLGLASDPRLAAAAAEGAQEEGWGAGASPLISGYAAGHHRLEQALANFEGAESALLFTSGYAANMGTIAALAGHGDAIFSDELNHASIVDGCRLSRAEVLIYRHGDVNDLARMLAAGTPAMNTGGPFRRRLIVTDSLFSMHGDIAPLPELAELAKRHACMLMVDEAHATGVFGEHGRGLCEQFGLEKDVDIRVGTLSKALGCSGGFVCGQQRLIDFLINKARSYVFSTASPPANSDAARAALAIVQSEPGRRAQLLTNADDLRSRLSDQGWRVGGQSQIIPVIIGNPEKTMQLAAALRGRGLWVPGIRPPSVPEGSSCLRISLSYAHTAEMIERLVGAMGTIR